MSHDQSTALQRDHHTDDTTTVLVTGASSGIGSEFARHWAARGADVVLTARRTDRLEALADELRSAHATTVHVVSADLGSTTGVTDLLAELTGRGLQIDVLINNAGFGEHSDVVDADPANLESMVVVNVLAVTSLTARLLPGMVERGRGAIVNVASTAAFQPVPHMATYSASKAYVLTFTRALWAETRGTGVDVLALCPGATDTEFFETAGEAASLGRRRSPVDVVETAAKALRRGRPDVVDGTMNGVLAAFSARMPTRLGLRVAGALVSET